jgi:hypothetical protein
MKNIKFTYKQVVLLLGFIFVTVISCERDLSDEAVFATFPSTAEIYTDNPVGLTDQFFVSFDPATGANTEAFGTDDNEAFEGRSSIRIDVPAPDDANGNFVGGIFLDRGDGRDLSGYNALTLYIKGNITATVDAIGFGADFDKDKFTVSLSNIRLSTDWKKLIIPIPDPSKLIQEKGLFGFSTGTISTNGIGYTFWMDEIRFENLGSVAQPQPSILNGEDVVQQTFNGSTVDIAANGLTQTFNVNGSNVTVSAAPAYFLFNSSNPGVATVDENGLVTIHNEGTTKITASIAGVAATGSLEITSSGNLPESPVPMQSAANVKSIYSDAYTADTASNFNPGFGGSTTQTTEGSTNGNNVQIYTNNNFTGIIFNNTVDASALSFLHVDIYTQQSDTSVEFQIRDVGANGEIETNVTTGFPDGDDKDFRFTASGLTPGAWTSLEIPLSGDIANQKNNLGAIILAGGPDFILDNIYFYTE